MSHMFAFKQRFGAEYHLHLNVVPQIDRSKSKRNSPMKSSPQRGSNSPERQLSKHGKNSSHGSKMRVLSGLAASEGSGHNIGEGVAAGQARRRQSILSNAGVAGVGRRPSKQQ